MVVRYEVGWFQAAILFRLKGSVFKDALLWAVPCACLSSILKVMDQAGDLGNLHEIVSPAANNAAFGGFSFLVGFIIVFRTGQSYSRFMDAMGSVHQMMGEWLDCACSIVSFAKASNAPPEEKTAFLHTVIRLFSVLSASALQELTQDQGGLRKVSAEEGRQRTIWLETIDRCGLDPDTVSLMNDGKLNTPLLVYQWMQQIVLSRQSDLLQNIPAPILARVFNELAAGMTKFHDTLLLSHIPFPFPYAQTTVTLLIMHWMLTPLVMVQWTNYPWAAWVFTFTQVFILWALNAIATGIERPFAGQPNDINPYIMQKSMNMQLLNLVNPKATRLPGLAPGIGLDYVELRSKWAKERKKNDAAYAESLRQDGWLERMCRLSRLARDYLRRRGRPLPATSSEALSEPLSALKEQRCSQHGDKAQSTIITVDSQGFCGGVERRPSTSTYSGRGPLSPTLGPAAASLDGVDPRLSVFSGSGVYPSMAALAAASLPEPGEPPQLPLSAQGPSSASLATTEPLRAETPLQATASSATLAGGRTRTVGSSGSQSEAPAISRGRTQSEGWLAGASSPLMEPATLRLGMPVATALPGVPDGEASDAMTATEVEVARVLSQGSCKGGWQVGHEPAPVSKKAGDATWGDCPDIVRTSSNKIGQRLSGSDDAALTRKVSTDSQCWNVESVQEVPPPAPVASPVPKVDSTASIVEVAGRAGQREVSLSDVAKAPARGDDEVVPIQREWSGKAEIPPLIRVESMNSIDGTPTIHEAVPKEQSVAPREKAPEPPPNTPPRLALATSANFAATCGGTSSRAADAAAAGGDRVQVKAAGGPVATLEGGGGGAAASASTAASTAVAGADTRQPSFEAEPSPPVVRVASQLAASEPIAVVPAPADPGRPADAPLRPPGSPRTTFVEAQPDLSRATSGASAQGREGSIERVAAEATAEAARAAAAGAAPPDVANMGQLDLPPSPWPDQAPSRSSSTLPQNLGEMPVVPEVSEPRTSISQASYVEMPPDLPEANFDTAEDPETPVPGVMPALERMESNASEMLGGRGGFLPF